MFFKYLNFQFKKALKSKIKVIILLQFLAFVSSFTIETIPCSWAGLKDEIESSKKKDLPPGIELPPAKTLEDRLKIIMAIRQQIPSLFSSVASYPISLFKLVKSQHDLLSDLSQDEKFIAPFKDKKWLDLTFTPPKDGIKVQETTLSKKAVSDWQSGLIQILSSVEGSHSAASFGKSEKMPLGSLLRDRLKAAVQERGNEKVEAEAVALLHRVGEGVSDKKQSKKNLEYIKGVINKDESGKEASLHERLKRSIEALKADRIEGHSKEDQQSILADLQKFENTFQSRLKAKRQVEELVMLSLALKAELGSAFKDETVEKAKDTVAHLSQGTLLALGDPDYLEPRLGELARETGEKELTALSSLQGRLKVYLSQVESKSELATEPVVLKEVPPWLGVFRGTVGDDCSTELNATIPNDPHQRTFFIYNHEGKLKGSVSATEVLSTDSQGKVRKALYLITVTGKNVSGKDTEVLIRGLSQASVQKELGVEEIILPPKERLSSLINFVPIQAIFGKHAGTGPLTKMTYQDPELRQKIEKYESKFNQKDYDYMEKNTEGVSIQVSPLKADVTSSITATAPFSVKVSPLKKSEVIELLLDLDYADYHKDLEEIYQIRNLPITKAEMDEAIRVLKNRNKKTLKEYHKEVADIFKKWEFTPKMAEEKKYLTYLGQLSAPDAHDPENIKETAATAMNALKRSKFGVLPRLLYFIDVEKLYRSDEKFKIYLDQNIEAFLSSDSEDNDLMDLIYGLSYFHSLSTLESGRNESAIDFHPKKIEILTKLIGHSIKIGSYKMLGEFDSKIPKESFDSVIKKALEYVPTENRAAFAMKFYVDYDAENYSACSSPKMKLLVLKSLSGQPQYYQEIISKRLEAMRFIARWSSTQTISDKDFEILQFLLSEINPVLKSRSDLQVSLSSLLIEMMKEKQTYISPALFAETKKSLMQMLEILAETNRPLLSQLLSAFKNSQVLGVYVGNSLIFKSIALEFEQKEQANRSSQAQPNMNGEITQAVQNVNTVQQQLQPTTTQGFCQQ